MANFGIKLPNGEHLVAPFEEWLAAILTAMTEEERGRVCARLKANKQIGAWSTPGSHILRTAQAEVFVPEKLKSQ